MDETFVNFYVESSNKRLEEFIKNEVILNARISLAEKVISMFNEEKEKIQIDTEEFNAKIGELESVISSYESQLQTVRAEKEQSYQVNQNTIQGKDIVISTLNDEKRKLEDSCNDLISKMKNKEDEIDILKETHKKEIERIHNSYTEDDKKGYDKPEKDLPKIKTNGNHYDSQLKMKTDSFKYKDHDKYSDVVEQDDTF